ncbi:signal peptidase I [Streptomyces sp. 2333.5]|uniref:signal peptidase I n=1 Tax=unclassified Streptomyces TaxID=2593676 RepID=UPI000896AAAB|nr:MULTISPECIES: signal peptidase I [unclassified Streptomyces]PJJ04753.1 signal peptidase I [Streptomyces sp. 2333.5]SEE59641.1 signal peptidase I Serine peptidase. MEROPS family S26A [Streptomyces sp. 2314.4]SEE86645.1 signal peptidase I Serine peptidase. MEROPS family S26A [Streptomyces sp. 2112.2]
MGSRGRPRHGSKDTGRRGRAAVQPQPDAGSAYGDSGGPGDPQEPATSPGPRAGRAASRGRAGRPATGGRAERRRQARRIKRRRQRSYLKEIPILIGVALAIALVLKTFLVQAFVIPSGSMEQTIKIGDRVLVDKLTPWFGSKPERGDVVVFKDPGGWLKGEQTKPTDDGGAFKPVKDAMTFIGLLPSANEQDLIKRVVAVGGDTVKCCDKQGKVTVNGTPLTEPYVHPGNPPSTLKFSVTVPTGRIFVMGDHRSNSADSRFHLDEPYRGTVSEDKVVGRAQVIAWPFKHWRRLEEPDTFTTVHDAPGAKASAAGVPHRVSPESLTVLPTPAELPLVMGVVGLRRLTRGRVRGVRSRCGGLGGRRAVRNRRARRAGTAR